MTNAQWLRALPGDGPADRAGRASAIWLNRTKEVADGFCAVVDGSAADFGEAERSMESVRCGIGRDEIDFANDAGMAVTFCALKQVGVEGLGMAFATREERRDDEVDVDETVVAFAKPEKIGAVVGGGLIEGDEEGGTILQRSREKTCLN